MLQKLLLLLYFVLSIAKICRGQCGKEDYKRCVMLADPLLRDARLIYPDNLKDIEHVCRKWQEFVDCVTRYTDLCFTENKRKEFHKAVASPVDLVHQMCTSSEYQQEYLKYAPCMRTTLTDDSHCGRHYRHLVSQVSGEPATPALCCSHFRFRECLLDQTKRTCEGDASPFAKHILDKAMGFLKDQCSSYKPDHTDCPGSDFYSGSSNRVTQSWTEPTARVSPEGNPIWPAEEKRTTMKKYNWLTQIWTATSPESQSAENVESTRTGYSRGMSWDPSTDPVTWKVSNALQTESSWPLSPTQKVTTVNNLLVDEPNQQGLSNENNVATSISKIDDFLYKLVFMILILTNI